MPRVWRDRKPTGPVRVALVGTLIGMLPGLVLLSFMPLFASLYPLTQLYQFEEDRQRGDRTLALILGMRRSLQLAVAAALAPPGLQRRAVGP